MIKLAKKYQKLLKVSESGQQQQKTAQYTKKWKIGNKRFQYIFLRSKINYMWPQVTKSDKE